MDQTPKRWSHVENMGHTQRRVTLGKMGHAIKMGDN